MSSSPKVRKGLTLDEFLRMPEIDEQPCQEYIDGRIEAKVAAQKKHSLIAKRLMDRLGQFAEPTGLGLPFPELRCTFAGRSIVPDVVFLIAEHIDTDDRGELVNETFRPPDIMVEIISPEQTATKTRKKLAHATAHDCALGWLIHPERRWIEVYRPGRPPERLPSDGVLEGEPVLPGFRLPVAEVFGWLIYRPPVLRTPPEPGAEPS